MTGIWLRDMRAVWRIRCYKGSNRTIEQVLDLLGQSALPFLSRSSAREEHDRSWRVA